MEDCLIKAKDFNGASQLSLIKKPKMEKKLFTILKLCLTPFIILSLWFCLGVLKDVAKTLFVKEKKVKTVGFVISK